MEKLQSKRKKFFTKRKILERTFDIVALLFHFSSIHTVHYWGALELFRK